MAFLVKSQRMADGENGIGGERNTQTHTRKRKRGGVDYQRKHTQQQQEQQKPNSRNVKIVCDMCTFCRFESLRLHVCSK